MSDIQPAKRAARPPQTLDLRHATPGKPPARVRRPLPAQPQRRPTVTRSEGMVDPLRPRAAVPPRSAPQPAAAHVSEPVPPPAPAPVAPPAPSARPHAAATATPATSAAPAQAQSVEQPAASQTKPAAQPKPAPKPKPAKPHRSLVAKVGNVVQYPLIAAGALLAAYSTAFGQWIVLIFVIFAIVLRKPSSLTFGSALFLLITIPLFQLLGQSGIAENVAVYVFELLVFGVAQALWELRKERAV